MKKDFFSKIVLEIELEETSRSIPARFCLTAPGGKRKLKEGRSRFALYVFIWKHKVHVRPQQMLLFKNSILPGMRHSSTCSGSHTDTYSKDSIRYTGEV